MFSNAFYSYVYALLLEPLSYLIHGQKRIFVLYLFSALALAWFLAKKNDAIKNALPLVFTKKYWLNASSYVDVKWIFLNQSIKVLFIVPLFISQLALTLTVYRLLLSNFGQGDFVALPTPIVMALFTILLFIVDDLSRFLLHYAYHKIPFLWRFHAIHHSAEVLTPLTLYRVHTLEFILNNARHLLVSGTVSGIFIYCVNGQVDWISVLGVNIFVFAFNLFGANLRHSHIPLSFGKLEAWFISPLQHQIHHSSDFKHLDKNFGSCLAVWDRIFRSWHSEKNISNLTFGLYKQHVKQQLLQQLKGL